MLVADREVQRILLELLNQMDGFDQNVNVKVRKNILVLFSLTVCCYVALLLLFFFNTASAIVDVVCLFFQ